MNDFAISPNSRGLRTERRKPVSGTCLLGLLLSLSACDSLDSMSGTPRELKPGPIPWPASFPNPGSGLFLEAYDATDRKTYFANLGVDYLSFVRDLSAHAQNWPLDANWREFHRAGHSFRFSVTAALPPHRLNQADGNIADWGILTTAAQAQPGDFNRDRLFQRLNSATHMVRIELSYLGAELTAEPQARASAVVPGGTDASWEVRGWDILGVAPEQSLFLNGRTAAEALDTESRFYHVGFDPKRSEQVRLLGSFRLNGDKGTLRYTPAPKPESRDEAVQPKPDAAAPAPAIPAAEPETKPLAASQDASPAPESGPSPSPSSPQSN